MVMDGMTILRSEMHEPGMRMVFVQRRTLRHPVSILEMYVGEKNDFSKSGQLDIPETMKIDFRIVSIR